MSSSTSAAFRRDKQLQELVDGKNFKQALSLCDKSIKKGDKTEHLMITRINILLAYPEPARQQQGRRELDEILRRPQPISEALALASLDLAARARKDIDPRIDEIWERATSVRPHDEDLYVKWFRTMFEKRKWKAAQKASMMYMKKFPEKREPFFWNIITCELAGNDPSASDMDRKVLRPLAFGFLSKAAADAAVKGLPRKGRSIQTAAELSLLLRIYRSQDKIQEAISILDSPLIGIKSELGRSSLDLMREKIELYELCNRWEDEWQFCRDLLESIRPSKTSGSQNPEYYWDDWKVWLGLITAAMNINTADNTKLTETLIESYVYPETLSRNARIALLKFLSFNASQDADVQDKLLSACHHYFLDYSDKAICFFDLQPYISCLERGTQEELLRRVRREIDVVKPHEGELMSKGIKWIITEINVLKLDYFVVFSSQDGFDGQNCAVFISNCLRLYKLSLHFGAGLAASERKVGDDVALLAVMALTHLLESGQNNALLRCIVILELLISHSKYNYDALLTLVRLHVRFGSGSLAIENYSQLSIKNLQHATMSWILYARISTIHPFTSSPSRRYPSPTNLSNGIVLGIEWHKHADSQNNSSINQMIDDGQYSMLFDSLLTDNLVKNGLTKYMLLAELQRIYRFSESTESAKYSKLLGEIPLELEDSRDTTAFPDYDAPNQSTFVDRLNYAPWPDHFWVGLQLQHHQLWNFLLTKQIPPENFSIAEMVEHNNKGPSALTDVEFEISHKMVCLRSLVYVYYKKLWSDGIDNLRREVHLMLQKLDDWLSILAKESKPGDFAATTYCFELSSNFAIPDWNYFHTKYSCLEICRFTNLALDYVLSESSKYKLLEPSILSELSASIKESIADIYSNIKQHACALQSSLQKKVSVEKFIELGFGMPDDKNDVVGFELRNLVSEPKMEEIASDVCESWVDALEGLIRVKPL